jgi:hypothetical protein
MDLPNERHNELRSDPRLALEMQRLMAAMEEE